MTTDMTTVEAARRIYRALEMSAAIMRDPARTGGWEGAERTADAFDRQAIAAKALHAALAAAPAGYGVEDSETLTPAQLSATCDALSFVIAGEWDEASHGHRVEVYERAHEKLIRMNGRVRAAALASPRAAVGEQSREAIASAAADGCDDQHPDGRRVRDGEKWWCAYDGAMRALALQSPPAKVAVQA